MKSVRKPVSVSFGPKYSERLSKSELLSLLRSDLRGATNDQKDPPRPSLKGRELSPRGRVINLVVLHVSDTKPSQNFTLNSLAACHKARGFGEYIGYHFYIRRDGTLYYTRPVYLKGCHVAGHNANSIGICSEGGHRNDDMVTYSSFAGGSPPKRGSEERVHEDNRTAEQMIVLHELLTTLHSLIPDAKLCGHHDLNPGKACPCMDPPAAVEYAYIFNS